MHAWRRLCTVHVHLANQADPDKDGPLLSPFPPPEIPIQIEELSLLEWMSAVGWCPVRVESVRVRCGVLLAVVVTCSIHVASLESALNV